MRILFQGDSITDAARDKRNYHHMGNGYPKFASALIAEAHPDTDLEFINFGISGNRTCQLFDRLYTDGIAFEPDIISILIGINDVWHRHGSGQIATTDLQVETNYRAILERLKNRISVIHLKDGFKGGKGIPLGEGEAPVEAEVVPQPVEAAPQQNSAEAPLIEMLKYATDLRSMTQGRGRFESEFLRYETVPFETQKKIIADASK